MIFPMQVDKYLDRRPDMAKLRLAVSGAAVASSWEEYEDPRIFVPVRISERLLR